MDQAFVCNEDFGRADLADVIEILAAEGATFAIVHGSSVNGNRHESSDFDVAAYFSGSAPISAIFYCPLGSISQC
jgi:predicted nucleotidyltransferase